MIIVGNTNIEMDVSILKSKLHLFFSWKLFNKQVCSITKAMINDHLEWTILKVTGKISVVIYSLLFYWKKSNFTENCIFFNSKRDHCCVTLFGYTKKGQLLKVAAPKYVF